MISMPSNNERVNQLKRLLSITIDGIEVYRQSLKNAESAETRSLFKNLLIQRNEYAEELKDAVRSLGSKRDDASGSKLSALGRLWKDIKATISNDAELSTLEACADDERAVLEEYELVLDDPGLDLKLREMLTDQKNGIERALARAEQMARIYK